jgi:Domain of unknown function (DUF4221)
MLKLLYLPLALLLLALACSPSDTQKTSDNQPVLVITDRQLTFPLDSNTANHTDFLSLYTDPAGREYLAYASKDKQQNRILFYALAEQKLAQVLTLATEGPDGVGKMRGFYVKDMDNVYVASRSTLFIALVGRDGRIKQKFSYQKTDTGEGPFPANVRLGNLSFVGGRLLLPMLPDGNWTYMTQADLDQKPICLAIDTASKSVAYLPFTFPKDYWRAGKLDAIYRKVKVGDQFVYAFLGDHHLYATPDHQQVAKHLAQSQFIDKLAVYPKDMDMDSYLRYMSENSFYGPLLHDPYRKVFYRFVHLGDEVQKGEDLAKRGQFPPLVSIVVLDEGFKVLGEVKLPRRRFATNNAFVARDGLYLSDAHPDNPALKENALTFTLIKLGAKRQ